MSLTLAKDCCTHARTHVTKKQTNATTDLLRFTAGQRVIPITFAPEAPSTSSSSYYRDSSYHLLYSSSSYYYILLQLSRG